MDSKERLKLVNRMNEINNPPPVKTKRDFVRRYKLGEFGNRSPTWEDLHSFMLDDTVNENGLYHLRNRIADGPTWYDIPHSEVPHRWRRLIADGESPHNLYLSEMAPTERTVIQGEIQQVDKPQPGTVLTYSTVAKPMRDALKEERLTAWDLKALSLVALHMNPKSIDWLNILFQRYPGHVIEFSVYEQNWGTLAGFNTVFWEVRNY